MAGACSLGSDSNASSSLDEHYLSGVPRVPLEIFQEELRLKMASSLLAGPLSHIPASIASLDEEEDILYCCAVGIPSKINEKKLGSIRSWYQIIDDLNLAVQGEWCFSPCLGVVPLLKTALSLMAMPPMVYPLEMISILSISWLFVFVLFLFFFFLKGFVVMDHFKFI